MPETVELHQAFMWDCPDCGRENFSRAVTVELTPEERRAMDVENPELAALDGDWLMAPESVTCTHCGKEFEAKEHDDD